MCQIGTGGAGWVAGLVGYVCRRPGVFPIGVTGYAAQNGVCTDGVKNLRV